jgi:hypothetical protein
MAEPGICAAEGCGKPLPNRSQSRGRSPVYCSNPCRYKGERAKRVEWNFSYPNRLKSHHKIPYRRLPGD